MTSNPTHDREKLYLGIEAARSGQTDVARRHLTKVLDQDPHFIPALFWMAYVAPSPHESIGLLKRVLVLDPENERARAGIRWAQQRLQPEPVEAEPEQASAKIHEHSPLQAAEASPEMPDEFIRQQLLTQQDHQKRAKKGALAHRARRTIDPLLTILVILGAVAILTASVWIRAFAPADSLAAWLPAPVENVLVNANAITMVSEEVVSPEPEQKLIVPAQSFTSASDTIIVGRPQLDKSNLTRLDTVGPFSVPEPEVESNELITLAKASGEARTRLDGAAEYDSPDRSEGSQPNLDPNSLIGPADMLLTGPRLFEPVAEELLAHKPEDSDEKWIEVNVTEQRVTAWEGNVPVMSFLTSTGLPNTPTILGKFNIYWKLKSTLMTGPGYYLPEVPYTMYFYAGYALHGAYWHNNFGNPMSRGCVNLSIDNARELFEWAEPVIPSGRTQVLSSNDNAGTLVVVHK